MTLKDLIRTWFTCWESGQYRNIPVTEDFRHTSPYGTINGKQAYLDLVKLNEDQFLGHRFIFHDEIYTDDIACVRYTAVQGDFRLEATEWYYRDGDLISEIISYYNMEGEISTGRTLTNPENGY